MGVGVQHHALAVLIPGKGSCTYCIGNGVGTRAGLDGWRKYCLHHDSISGLSGQWQVTIPTALFQGNIYILQNITKSGLEHLIRSGFMAIAPTRRTVDICKKMDRKRVCLTSMTFVHKLVIAILMTIGMVEVMSYTFKICSSSIEIIKFFCKKLKPKER
jgi:hypothetical protein